MSTSKNALITRLTRLLSVSFTCALLLTTIPASAQEDDEEDDMTTSEMLMEELTVTARKRTESLQVVPVAVSALSGDQLEANFYNDLEDVTYSVPNAVAYQNNTFPGYVNYFIRGMGVAGTVLSDDPAVGVFVDGVYLGISAGVLMDTFDLESVEVLRGPQGTLFGRNVTGGATLIRTRKPTEEFSSRARLIAGSDGRLEGVASVSGPMSENLLGKVTVFYKERDDWMSNPYGNALGFDDLGEQQQKAVRGALTWMISDAVTADLRLEWGDSKDDPGPIWAIDNTALLGIQPIPGISEPGATKGKDSISNGVLRDPINTDWTSINLEVNWEMGPGQLKSITGFRNIDQDNLTQDFDGSVVQLFDVNNSYLSQEQFSQEFVYNWALANGTQFTAGVYYFDQNYQYGERRFGILFAPFGTGKDPVLGADVGGLQTQSDTDHEVMGLFLQADIRLGANWNLTLGGRYTSEEKSTAIGQFGAGLLDGSLNCTDLVSQDPRDCPPNFRGKEDWGNFTPKVGLQWFASDDHMLYASWTQGFRSGGFNIRQTVGALPGPYDEEQADAYEVGFKSEFAANRLRLNGALFYNDYSDLQRTVVSEEGFQTVLNAAEATISGVELELSWLVTDNFLLQGSYGYIDTELQDFLNPGTGQVISGTEIAFVPDYQLNLSANYDWVLNPGTISFRISYHKEDGAESTDDNLGYPGPGWDQTDASISYAASSGRWRLAGFVRNLSDNIETNLITSAINPGWVLGSGRLPKRYGVELTLFWD